MIGIEETSVFVDEDNGTLTLCARVMSGTLANEIVIRVIEEPRNALGTYKG